MAIPAQESHLTKGSTMRFSQIIRGTDGNDVIFGGDLASILYGGAGADTLQGGRANDILGGGAGNDVLTGDNDWYNGGNDLIMGGAGDDSLSGLAGDDKLRGNSGNDNLWGGKGSDDMEDKEGNNTFGISAGDHVKMAGLGGQTLIATTDDLVGIVNLEGFTARDTLSLINLGGIKSVSSFQDWHGVDDSNFTFSDVSGDGKTDMVVQVKETGVSMGFVGTGIYDLAGVHAAVDAGTLELGHYHDLGGGKGIIAA